MIKVHSSFAQDMEARGIKADVRVCTALIGALGAAGMAEEALAVFRTMACPSSSVLRVLGGFLHVLSLTLNTTQPKGTVQGRTAPSLDTMLCKEIDTTPSSTSALEAVLKWNCASGMGPGA